jgi:hypothetical protein
MLRQRLIMAIVWSGVVGVLFLLALPWVYQDGGLPDPIRVFAAAIYLVGCLVCYFGAP